MLPTRLVWVFSKKYIAGKHIDDAIGVAKLFSQQGIHVSIDLLGEHMVDQSKIEKYKRTYLDSIKKIGNLFNITYSLKPTMFGLEFSEEEALGNIREIVLVARKNGKMVRLDMENPVFVDQELSLFKTLYNEFPGSVGLVLQAYLKRSMADVKDLLQFEHSEYPLNIRLCKGIYMESPKIVFTDPKKINDNFMEMLEFMVANNMYPGIATHDQDLIDRSATLIKKYKVNKENYEFQMLYGVTEKRRAAIVEAGHNMRVYVPFGEDWFNYSARRLKENPRLVNHIIKSLFIKL